MAKSAGILLYRRRGGTIEVFLVHPGGPFWANKDLGAWSVPKGVVDGDEDPLEAAKREFREETGFDPPDTGYVALGSARQKSGKRVEAWAVPGDCDAAKVRSNTFRLEWPPRSGLEREFAEVDRAAWFELDEAALRVHSGQRELLARLAKIARQQDAPGS